MGTERRLKKLVREEVKKLGHDDFIDKLWFRYL